MVAPRFARFVCDAHHALVLLVWSTAAPAVTRVDEHHPGLLGVILWLWVGLVVVDVPFHILKPGYAE